MSEETPTSFLHMVSNSAEAAAGAILHAPSAERNFAPILDVLREVLPPSGRALEVASGTGLHIAGFASAFPGIEWLPNDPDPHARASIAARRAEAGLANLAAPTGFDATVDRWFTVFEPPLSAVLAINLIHIAPWAACLGVLDAGRALLAPGGIVYFYGCFSRGGVHLSQSNITFDRSLRARNPDWGVRDTDEVAAAGAARGLEIDRIVEMPANNLSVILRLKEGVRHPVP